MLPPISSTAMRAGAAIYAGWSLLDVAGYTKDTDFEGYDSSKSFKNRSTLQLIIYCTAKTLATLAAFAVAEKLGPAFVATIGLPNSGVVAVVTKIGLGWYLADFTSSWTSGKVVKILNYIDALKTAAFSALINLHKKSSK